MAEGIKFLQLTNKPPFPPMDGGAIGMNNISQGLINEGYNLKICSVNTHKHFVDIANLPEEYISKTSIEFGFIDTRIKNIDALINLFSSKSYNIKRFFDKKFESKLIEILLSIDFDIVQMESIFLMYYLPTIRKYSKAKVILRAPNVEFKIWERLAHTEKNILKKFYLKLLASRLKKEEMEILNKFDALYTVTESDMKIFQSLGANIPMTYIPTGMDVTKIVHEKNNLAEELSLFHIGALDWRPNQEGLMWFLENVWDKLTNEFPDLKFYLAGRRPPQWIKNLSFKNLIILGEIDDAEAFINAHSIMIVPLFSGSGMRVKIVEGMMLGKAIISTNIGAEGIVFDNGCDIIIADTEEEFISAIRLLVNDSEKLQSLKNNAHTNSKKNYSDEVLTKKLIDFLSNILSV